MFSYVISAFLALICGALPSDAGARGSACTSGAGACCEANGSPGCDDGGSGCCADVCACDPYCCQTEWDDTCATESDRGCGAAVQCPECFDADGDGVPDQLDVCDNTPDGIDVDEVGRPLGDVDQDCDTDLIDYELFQRGFTGTLAPAGDRTCDPVAQTGCNPGEKCTFVRDVENPAESRTFCRPEGSVQAGNVCTSDAVTGLDNCVAGLFCAGGICAEICSVAPDSCPSGYRCAELPGLVDSPGVGSCQVVCDPLSDPSGCSGGEACYIVTAPGTSMCATPATTDTQGAACEYINSCASGYGCILLNSPVNPTGMECAFICDALQGGGPTCAEGSEPSYTCAQINRFYSGIPELPDAWGMCVDPVEWDEDGDGVFYLADQCPDTPPGTPVDDVGCPPQRHR